MTPYEVYVAAKRRRDLATAALSEAEREYAAASRALRDAGAAMAADHFGAVNVSPQRLIADAETILGVES